MIREETNGMLDRERQRAGLFDVRKIRLDFPILHQKIKGNPLVYLDNAASTQKPKSVIEAISNYYSQDNANIHRGVHALSQRATDAYEKTRETARKFINASKIEEIIFVRGTTEAINLVAQSFGRSELKTGDEILVTTMEHHSNIVPWQQLCEQTGAKLRVAPIDDNGDVIVEEFEKLLGDRTKIVSFIHVSNALGTITPAKKLIEMAKKVGAVTLLDGAQAVAHVPVDVQDLDCDFYAFSGHKIYGPTGVGVLYGKESLLKKMPPYQGGGDMIAHVTFERTVYNALPYKFEAGTPNIAGVIGLGAALDYVSELGIDAIASYEDEVLDYATSKVGEIEGLKLIGTAKRKTSVLSFSLEGIHPHDIGTILDSQGIAVRTGHHCAQPVMDRFQVPATTRASFGIYNTKEEADRLVEGLKKVLEVFA